MPGSSPWEPAWPLAELVHSHNLQTDPVCPQAGDGSKAQVLPRQSETGFMCWPLSVIALSIPPWGHPHPSLDLSFPSCQRKGRVWASEDPDTDGRRGESERRAAVSRGNETSLVSREAEPQPPPAEQFPLPELIGPGAIIWPSDHPACPPRSSILSSQTQREPPQFA